MRRLCSCAAAAKEVVAGHIRTLQQYQPSTGGIAPDAPLGEDTGARRVSMHAGCTALRLLQVRRQLPACRQHVTGPVNRNLVAVGTAQACTQAKHMRKLAMLLQVRRDNEPCHSAPSALLGWQ